MNELLLARRIKEALDADLNFGPQVTVRLAAARDRALERYRVPEEGLAIACCTRSVPRLGKPSRAWSRLLVPLALFAAAAIALQQWQDAQQAATQSADIEESDAALLADYLPIEAYLDRDFQSWLKRSSQ